MDVGLGLPPPYVFKCNSIKRHPTLSNCRKLMLIKHVSFNDSGLPQFRTSARDKHESQRWLLRNRHYPRIWSLPRWLVNRAAQHSPVTCGGTLVELQRMFLTSYFLAIVLVIWGSAFALRPNQSKTLVKSSFANRTVMKRHFPHDRLRWCRRLQVSFWSLRDVTCDTSYAA